MTNELGLTGEERDLRHNQKSSSFGPGERRRGLQNIPIGESERQRESQSPARALITREIGKRREMSSSRDVTLTIAGRYLPSAKIPFLLDCCLEENGETTGRIGANDGQRTHCRRHPSTDNHSVFLGIKKLIEHTGLGVYPLYSTSTRPLLDLCSISSCLLDVILYCQPHPLYYISSSLLDPFLLDPPLLNPPLLDPSLFDLYSTSTRPHPLCSISSSLVDPCLVDPLLPEPPLVCPPLVDPYLVDPPLLDPRLLDLVLSARSRLLCLVRRRTDHPFRTPYPECAGVACFDKTGTLTGEDLVVDGIAGLSLGKKSVQNEASGRCAVLGHQGPRLRHSYHTTLVLETAHALIKTELEDRDIVGDPMEKATTAHALIKLEEGDIVGDTMEKATLDARNWTLGLDDTLISTPRDPGGRS
ncbi:hypothetical protein FOPE_10424 [Fonsecaea pedrosoi]|nr:hypothetical protein FOPE_10424 [Fonsecaea pedrosoi]